MANEGTRIQEQLQRAFAGRAWHGPSILELLADVDAVKAAARPIAGAHSIWEIVKHVTAWAEIARQRIHGEALGDPTAEQDWPPIGDDWAQDLERLKESHRRLAADVRRLDDAALDARVKTLEYPVGILLDGVVEHGTYHGGQIALLKKA